MRADCQKFWDEHGESIKEAEVTCRCSNEAYAGHDFWLTRCGHGCGFWDGDWPDDLGEELTEACKDMGQCDLYVGDDGKVYLT